jgi:hypothetical protein
LEETQLGWRSRYLFHIFIRNINQNVFIEGLYLKEESVAIGSAIPISVIVFNLSEDFLSLDHIFQIPLTEFI